MEIGGFPFSGISDFFACSAGRLLSLCQQFLLLRWQTFGIFLFFQISDFFQNFLFSKISDFFFPLLSEGKMKIHRQTKRGLNTLKFGGYSEILTLIHRGKWKLGV